MKNIKTIMAFVVLSFVIFSFNFNNFKGKTQKNKAAVNFTLKDLQGKSVSLKDFRGKVVMLNFWSAWSAPSLKEMLRLEKISQNYGGKVQVIGIAVISKKNRIPEKVKTAGVTYPVLYGSKKTIADYGFFNSIPQTFVIDPQGKIAKELPGSHKYSELEKALKGVLDPLKVKNVNQLTVK